MRAVADLSLAGRFRAVAEHRSSVSRLAMSQFPADALRTPLEKVEAVAVQGFGRFGPLGPRGRTDSTVRFDARQDRGAWAWLPWVVAGFVCSLARGRDQLRRGEPPAAWAIALQAGVALAVVTAFIPLAWDRYFLSIQPGSALLGAVAAVALFDLVPPGWRAGEGRGAGVVRLLRRPEPWVFAILLASYAYFWHGRDWNSASRLMLTYALVDRGTIRIDGTEDQTHDIALREGHYYTDKTPGFSLLAPCPPTPSRRRPSACPITPSGPAGSPTGRPITGRRWGPPAWPRPWRGR